MLAIIALLAIVVVVFRATEPETRKQLAAAAWESLLRARQELTRKRPECEEFRDALRARTRWAVVTPALILANVVVLVLMIRAEGALSDPETLVHWGANFWLRTRNGEWWRLLASVFVHRSVLQLLINIAGLVQIGLILERLIGRLIVFAVFVTAGITASLVNLAAEPMATGAGASGAIFGLYGLALASSVWAIRHRSPVTMPWRVARRMVPAAALFVVYNLMNEDLGLAAEVTGMLAGLVSGAMLAKGVNDRKPAARPAAYTTAVAAAIVVVCAIPLRGITDVKPELERTVAAEDRIAETYQQAAERFRRNRMTAEALASLIDRTIIPELQVTDARLKALEAVPTEHQPLVADAEEYVRLRSESWRLRSEWLRKAGRLPQRGTESALYRTNSKTIAQAEERERAALDTLERIRPAAQRSSLEIRN
jgi:rhomboid protease GluP